MFAGDLVSRDFQKEGLFLLTQPISRRKLFFAKFLSALTVSIIAVAVYLFGSFITAYLLYKTIIPSWYQIILISFLAITALLSLVTLFSAVIKSPTMSITLSVFLLLILFL
jgi:ABC-type transport system involved in multi-copper enzyme maturation permease subunit